MKKQYILGSIGIIVAIALLLAFKNTPKKPIPMLDYNTDPYTKEWKTIDSLQNKGLPRSALEKVVELYEKAKSDNNPAQVVKTLLYRSKYVNQLEEDGMVMAIEQLQADVQTAEFPAKPLLQSILAQIYTAYLDNNRWQLQSRTEFASDQKPEDMRVWTMAQLLDESHRLFRASLSDDQSKQVPLDEFEDILNNDGDTLSGLRPTLYDFMAHEALGFLTNERSYVTQPAYQFQIDSERYFAPAKRFKDIKLEAKDESSPKLFALRIFKELINMHYDDADPAALVDADLKRLQFVNDNAAFDNKDKWYLIALEDLKDRYSRHEASAEISYYIASYYLQRANWYRSNRKGEQEGKTYYQDAEKICKDAIAAYPDSYGASLCKSLLSQIYSKSMQFRLEEVNLPGEPFLLSLEYRNLDKVWLRVAPITEDQRRSMHGMRYNDKQKFFKNLKTVKNWSVDLPDASDHHSHTVELPVEELPYGYYVVLMSDNEDFSTESNAISFAFTQVSSLGYWWRPDLGNKSEIFVADRSSGKPIENVNVSYLLADYSGRKLKWDVFETGKTDKDGRAAATFNSRNRNYAIKLEKGDDKLHLEQWFYAYGRYGDNKSRSATHFFTDRAIYRPGQTLYFKGVMMNHDAGGMPEIISNKSVEITLYDVNNQKVESLKLRSNAYGTVQGTFQLPQGGLTGQMYINSNYGNGTRYFSVEEYKRPKFEASFEPITGSFRLDETITVKGKAKAYAGNVIDGAKVTYRVMRQPRFPYRRGYYIWPSWEQPVQMATGTAKTDADGDFEITFTAKADKSIPADKKPVFDYVVSADITDISGETRSASTNVKVGYTSLLLSTNIGSVVAKEDTLKLPITATNLNGQEINAKGKVIIQRLKAPTEKPLRKRNGNTPDAFVLSEKEHRKMFPLDPYRDEYEIENWQAEGSSMEVNFDTKDAKQLTIDGRKLEPAAYKLSLMSKDSFGNKIETVRYFTLYNTESNTIPNNLEIVVDGVNDSYEPGEKLSAEIGSAFKTVMFLYEREEKGKIVKRDWITLKDWKKLEVEIEERHRGNFYHHLHFFKNNRHYEYANTINVPWSNKKLDITYGTFRDKLLPGQDEQWILKVSGPDKDKVAAEMVATLYDASLDAYRSNSWQLSPFPTYNPRNRLNAAGFHLQSSNMLAKNWNNAYYASSRSYPSLNWFGYSPGRRNYYRRALLYSTANMRSVDEAAPQKSAQPALEGNRNNEGESVEFDAVTAKEESLEEVADKATNQGESDASTAPAPAVRTNLKETVFFYPTLNTDEEGNVLIKFKMNEALTRWKFLGMAHTKDLKIGITQNEVVTQKELMVQPNPPRFMREFDKIEYVSKVVNMSDKPMSGTARLSLFNAVDMRPVNAAFGIQDNGVDFELDPGQSKAVKWKLNVPAVTDVSALVHRVTAEAGTFSDGEEAALPILTNRMLVTETMPLPIRGNQKKKFTFKRMDQVGKSETFAHHQYTLEFTSNPAWYAVQALPYLMEYPYECTEQIFSRYYANSLATSVANSHPKVKQVFDRWKQLPESSSENSTFSSALERNQELKSALLAETPWVMQAQSESQQKRNVGLLFDLNRMANEQEQALAKLSERQSGNGGFSWFPGGRTSHYITQYILEGIAHLDHLGVAQIQQDRRAVKITDAALAFVDAEVEDIYDDLEDRIDRGLTKWEDDHLNSIVVHYLYVRSFFSDKQLNNKGQKILDYYLGQAEKYWTSKQIYQQGLLALALHRYDKRTVTNDIVKSLKERSLYNDELGRYWKNDWGYFWYQLPIETQSLMVEVFAEVAKDEEVVDELKVWLLKNKQTTHWKTTKATSSAIYALLSYGDNWLLEDEPVEITLGKTKIDNADQRPEAGTGYFKIKWEKDEITPDMANIMVRNPNNHVAWGAVYWQYFENLDKITHFEDTPLKIKKELFISADSDAGQKLTPIDENTSLKPGTKIKVRIELRVDRDMEYVHMRDMRASGFEPVNVFSGYRWQGGLGYYESTLDASTNFFFDYLRKGTYVFEYPLWVQHSGDFSNGITTIQCMYAPEFTSHSEGVRVEVK